jgi:hypothetical protein
MKNINLFNMSSLLVMLRAPEVLNFLATSCLFLIASPTIPEIRGKEEERSQPHMKEVFPSFFLVGLVRKKSKTLNRRY